MSTLRGIMKFPGSWRAVAVALLLCVIGSPLLADEHQRGAQHLQSDLQSGSISGDDAVLYAAIAIRHPHLLPERYADSAEKTCGHALLTVLADELPKVHPEVRAVVKYLLAPPNKQATMKKPALKAAKVKDPALVQQAVNTAWDPSATLYVPTAHFRVAYTLSGSDATTLAYAQKVGNLLEQAYTSLAGHGFTMPAAPNDGKIDVALWANPCPLDVGLDCGNGGMALPPAISTLYGGDGDPLILIRTGISSDNFLRVLTAHELFHQVQYEMAGFLTVFPHWWVLEAQATAMEDVVWPAVNDYIRHVDDYYTFISQSLTLRSYDGVLFWKYLMMNHSGNNPSIIRDFLNAAGGSGVYDALKNTLVARGSTLDFAMHHFSLWNLFVASRFRSGHYDDANLPGWPDMSNFMDEHSLGAIKSVPTNLEHLAGLSMRYFRVTPDSTITSNRKLTVKSHGDSFGHIRGWVVHRRTNGSVDVRDMNLHGSGGSATVAINDFSSSTAEVVIILSNGFEGLELLADYSVSLPTSIDLAFCMDTTGSMSGSISALKSTATSAMTTLGSNGADFRMAITEFKDFPVSPYGGSGDFPYRANSPFSNTPSVILGGINMLVASGGGNWPESALSGVMGAINGQGIGAWRSGSNKSIVVMTDAPPHDPEPFTGYTRASVAAAALAGGITVAPFSRGAVTTSSDSVTAMATAETPIKIYGVVVGGDFGAYNALTYLANATGGKVWQTSYNPTDIAAAILEAIGEIGGGEEPPPPANRPPDVSGATADPSQLWSPNNKLVDVRITNVSDPDGDAVTINITGITQDEPVNNGENGKGEPDGAGTGTSVAQVRAERDGSGNGRVYAISFTASDGRGGSSSGTVVVCVPHDQGRNTVCTDDGQSFISTEP